MLEFLPSGQNVKKGSSEATVQISSKFAHAWMTTVCITNWDFFSIEDNAETGIVEKPGLVISYFDRIVSIVFTKYLRWMVEPEMWS